MTYSNILKIFFEDMKLFNKVCELLCTPYQRTDPSWDVKHIYQMVQRLTSWRSNKCSNKSCARMENPSMKSTPQSATSQTAIKNNHTNLHMIYCKICCASECYRTTYVTIGNVNVNESCSKQVQSAFTRLEVQVDAHTLMHTMNSSSKYELFRTG